jgi:hypothetical protein
LAAKLENFSPFEILKNDEIEILIDNTLQEISKLLQLNPSNVALLLRLFNWDKDKLYAKFFDDPDTYLKKAGIIVTPAPAEILQEPFEVTSGNSFH